MASALKSILLSDGRKIYNNSEFQEWIKENNIIKTNNTKITSSGSQLLIFASTKSSPVQSLFDENGYEWESRVNFNQIHNSGEYKRSNGSSYRFRIEKIKKTLPIIGNKFRANGRFLY